MQKHPEKSDLRKFCVEVSFCCISHLGHSSVMALVGTQEPKDEEKKEVEAVEPKSDADALVGTLESNDEEKKEVEAVSFRRKDESAQWAEYMKPKGYIGKGRFQKPDYSHLLDALRKYKPAFHLNKDGSVTFYPTPYLSNKELGSALLQQVPFDKSNQFQNIMTEVECTKLEASFDSEATVISAPNDVHGFIATLEIAFFKHYPLSLSVSQIWLLILQGLGACFHSVRALNFCSLNVII